MCLQHMLKMLAWDYELLSCGRSCRLSREFMRDISDQNHLILEVLPQPPFRMQLLHSPLGQ
jgi:hypothetical protein